MPQRCHGRPLLTVIVPVFNEAGTVRQLLERVVAAPYEKEVIVVNDGSTDGTAPILKDAAARLGVIILAHATNRGKGYAIRTGLSEARGRFTLIQDADLEYEPCDYPRLIEPLRTGRAVVVFGSRYLEPQASRGRWSFRMGVALLNQAVKVVYGARLTDEATCYKAMATSLLRELDLRCEGFEFCPEVTAKACRLGLTIHEVPVSYHPRGMGEGKKIRWRDGVSALRTLWRWRKWTSPVSYADAASDDGPLSRVPISHSGPPEPGLELGHVGA
jgi:glycosyltransferase involved in cell wall biosynthesis